MLTGSAICTLSENIGKLECQDRKENFSVYRPPGTPGGGGGAVYPHILAIRVCAAGEGMVFKPFSLV